jgi:hypothetical protein
MSEVRRRRVPRWARIALALLLAFIAIAVAILWTVRVELATGYIDGELARRGVQARYDVKRIGLGTQIFENLVIGDPRRPDLTARRVEVQILFGFTGPQVGLITARGVRMVGRIEGGRLSLGQIDRLLPPPSGEPFRLPDQRIDVKDAAIALATPAGDVALALSGRGNLANGFRGGLAVASRELRLGECVIAGPVARFMVRVTDRKPRVRGPAAMHSLRCGGDFVVERPLLALRSVFFEPGLDKWRGSAAMRVAALRTPGRSLADFEGHFTFAGNRRATAGALDFLSGQALAGAVRAARTSFEGRYALAPMRGGFSVEGRVGVQALTLDERSLRPLAGALHGAAGTPLGPIGDALAQALVRAGQSGAGGGGSLRLANRDGRGLLRLGGLGIESRSGARLTASGDGALSYSWPSGALRLDGGFALSGGGFPDARFAFDQPAPGAPLRGNGRIAPIAAGGARLALADIAFAAGPDGRTTFRTLARIDGPLGGGRVAGLVVPLSGRFGAGGFALGESCVAGRFDTLQLQTLRLGPSRLALCPAGPAMLRSGARGLEAGAELRAPRFAGRLGASPIALGADRLRIDRAGLTAARLAVRLGPNRLDVASLDGRFGADGVAGGFAGLSGDLAAVPLLVSEGRGRWRFERSRLALEGRLAVADRQAPARFLPLASEDFALTLAGNRIDAAGTLSHPQSGTRVMAARIGHDLASGAGNALIQVDRLRFSPRGLQPDALTPLTVGIVALVDGAVSGEGRIEWDARGTRSTGAFTTADMALAAPFGPVEGLSTTIRFTDLLGLASAPGQEARVRLIRAGIDVYDGVARYQLRPNYHVAVESARWPLAGGTLTLAPTILDFSRESTKYLTFRVAGLDAARFIQLMEFSNIAATGTYDGIVPMQFTQAGGRIVGGQLIARPEGGTLSYVGELSDRDLGAYGVLAFDALKSLRYSRLEISLDGALDGEFLTRIDMDGLARNPGGTREPGGGVSGMVVGRVLHQLARIPFHFNIRIEGRFRALIATARSFEDPRDLIRASLPQLLDSRTPPDSPVQPQESEPVR